MIRASVVPVVLAALGCTPSGLAVVPRYPYVEDRGLALAHETLTLGVERDGSVRVTALFHFVARGAPRDRVMTFPVARPRGGARGFEAELVGHGPTAVPVALGEPGALPMGDAVETWDMWVDGAALARSSGRLEVRYTQPGAGDFAYILKSGAYWSGPIERLVVVVADPHARVAAMQVEGRRIELAERRRVSVELLDVEPSDGVRLELR